MISSECHILIVDDEEGLRETICDILEDSGYVCHAADSGKAALEVLSSRPVDLAILDLIMPEMTGQALFHRMQEDYPGVPVVFLTAVDGPDLPQEYLRAGACDYLVKPVPLNLLRQRVESALGRKSPHHQGSDQVTLAERSTSNQHPGAEPSLSFIYSEMRSVAHDLDNALMPILTLSRLLQEQPPHLQDWSNVTRYLKGIHTAAEEAEQLVLKLRGLYKPYPRQDNDHTDALQAGL